jgi:hypothetical protein
MKSEGLNKIKNRKKIWDMFNWGYRSKQYLWKSKHLTDGCKICKWERFMKLYKHSQDRLKNRLVEQELLKRLNEKTGCGLRSYDDLHKAIEDLEKNN